MGSKTRSTMRSDLRFDLKDSGALWSDNELNRCIERAVNDLSRFMPRERWYEKTLVFVVAGESFTSEAAHATYKGLGNKPIKYQSEVVTSNPAGTTYTRDTDYYMDYTNGQITTISGGSMSTSTGYLISYTISQISLDLSSLSGFIRIGNQIIYPVGSIPQSLASVSIWDDVIWVEGEGIDTQASMSEKRHIAVQYLAEHTAPDDSAAGSFPTVLDWTVELAAAAYACFMKAVEMEHQAIDDRATMATELGLTGAIHTSCAAAFADVATKLGEADTALNNVATHAASAVTAAGNMTTPIGDAVAALDLVSADGTPATAAADVNTALDAAIVEAVLAATALVKIDAQGQPNLGDANTALDAALGATALGAVGAALDKVGVFLENNTNEDAKSWLTKITTDIAGLRTAALSALDAAKSYADEVDSTDLQGAEAVWADEVMHIRENIVAGTTTSTASFKLNDTGASFVSSDAGKIVHNITDNTWAIVVGVDSSNVLSIGKDIMESGEQYAIYHANLQAIIAEALEQVNKITTGAKVPERLSTLAQITAIQQAAWAEKREQWIRVGTARTNAALAFVQEATVRLGNINTYIAQAQGWMQIATGYISEGRARVETALGYISEAQARVAIADRWIGEAAGRNESAQAYISEANSRVALCQTYIAEARTRLETAAHFASQALQYLGACDAYIREGNSRIEMGNARISEGRARIEEINAHLQEAFNWQQMAALDLQVAEQFRNEGIDRRNEAWSIWRDPKQLMGDFTLTSLRQPSNYPTSTYSGR